MLNLGCICVTDIYGDKFMQNKKRRTCFRCKKRYASEGMYMCAKCRKTVNELSKGLPVVENPYVNKLFNDRYPDN